jgi:hypothetical protein
VLLGPRVAACLALAALSATAPYQCSRKVPHDERHEEGAEEVLYELAERFKAEGDAAARVKTLHYLVKKFPSSRYARMARKDLEALGEK